MGTLKASFHFYSRNVEYLMLLSFSILLPLLVVHLVVTNVVYRLYQGTPFTFYGDITNSFFMLLIFVIAQLPFIRYVWNDLEGEEKKLGPAYLTSLEQGLPVFGFALIYVLATMIGSALFILPGLAILVLLFLTPYVSVIKQKPVRKSWREALRWGKKKFFPLLGLILFISIAEWLISFVSMNGISLITKNYGAIVGSQLLISVLSFPFLVIYTTLTFQKWQGQSTGL